MHKTQKTTKESRINLMYSHLCDRTLEPKLTLRMPAGGFLFGECTTTKLLNLRTT